MEYRFAMMQASVRSNGGTGRTIFAAATVAGLVIAAAPLTVDLATFDLRVAIAFAMGGGNSGGGNSGGGNSGDNSGGGNGFAGSQGSGPANVNGLLNRNANAGSNGNGGGDTNPQLGGGEGGEPYTHGHRVRLFVKLAKLGGFNASVGALQANFGTPEENGLFLLQTNIDGLTTELGVLTTALDPLDPGSLASALADAILARQPLLDAFILADAALVAAIAGGDPLLIETATMDLATASGNLQPFQQDVDDAQLLVDAQQMLVDEKQAEIDAEQATLDAAIAEVKPGEGPFPKSDGVIWELVDLDYEGDGDIDETDIGFAPVP